MLLRFVRNVYAMTHRTSLNAHRRLRALALSAWPAALIPLSGLAHAQVPPAPDGVLNITATATVEVPKDWMTVTLATSREGADAASVQTLLKQAVDAALGEARKVAKPGQVEVQTGGFSIFPRYGTKGAMTGWQGQTELVIEGRDMAAIAQLTGRIGSLTIARVSQSLSREAREKVEADVSAQAVARFRARAADLAKQFGYAGYGIREVNVSTDSPTGGPMPMGRGGMMMAKADGAEALPVEAGKGTVTATVSGSVQFTK
jgi:predicted secreted protein